MLEGILLLMHSNLEGPVNIGCPQYVTVKELVDTVAEVSSKNINIKWVEGPAGVQSRNFSNAKIYSIGSQAKYFWP
jgi:NAD dependent epimerase/dehydratase family enzyme